jgi:hypothetical protein
MQDDDAGMILYLCAMMGGSPHTSPHYPLSDRNGLHTWEHTCADSEKPPPRVRNDLLSSPNTDSGGGIACMSLLDVLQCNAISVRTTIALLVRMSDKYWHNDRDATSSERSLRPRRLCAADDDSRGGKFSLSAQPKCGGVFVRSAVSPTLVMCMHARSSDGQS